MKEVVATLGVTLIVHHKLILETKSSNCSVLYGTLVILYTLPNGQAYGTSRQHNISESDKYI